jgi:hypothetical protein
MTDQNEKILGRLKRCAVWVETGRQQGLVSLQGFDGRKTCTADLPEAVLMDLLREGRVACDTQQRIALNENYVQPRPIEITQNDWRVTE